MGVVVNPYKAFELCHGYKIGDRLILWSPGVVGTLNKWQDRECKKIVIENAGNGEEIFDSYEEAEKAKVSNVIPEEHVRQIIAIRTCAHILHKAKMKGLIQDIQDVYSTLDYCIHEMGVGKTLKYTPNYKIKEFVDEELKETMEKLPKK